MLRAEQAIIDDALHNLYGFHLMQLGVCRDLNLTNESTIQHRFAFAPNPPLNEDNRRWVVATAELEKIPLANEVIDVALLHHVLEFSTNPHQLLRDVSRVVIPRGYVLIVGFNPFSWLGLFKLFAQPFSRKAHWHHRSLRQGRVVDWLRLLDFEVVDINHGFHRWPIDHPKVMAKTHWVDRLGQKLSLPTGGFYTILARKDVVGMTPIKPVWKKLAPISGWAGSGASSRVGQPVARHKKNTLH